MKQTSFSNYFVKEKTVFNKLVILFLNKVKRSIYECYRKLRYYLEGIFLAPRSKHFNLFFIYLTI